MVFDASAKTNNISLDVVILQGTKQQNDLVAVLMMYFHRDPAAIMCDLQKMCVQIETDPYDRPCHCFLWRDLDQSKESDLYKFQHVILECELISIYGSIRGAETR